ncbi:hypothetical protein HYPSUDRAFT_65742 [Hypholoma sublateritium FD-334 SS-4]|uniref:Uncharacterized protein n=1 Tax=Hypholoma sublateritium (strain FD-334 SS-4) TaxID=945553 RepID=A0A0D2MKL4_HYPSF|nr:hypothetical protein HYPSUDRAFT_65742 [Hypholoma sublateritium FD-334 SS-4]
MTALALTIPRTASPAPSPPSPYPSPYPSARPPPPSPPPSPPPPASSTATPASTALCTPSSSTASSRSSLPATAASSALNVKFAPLPQLAPRKRRSAAPLGMAARGALVRGRRGPPPLDDVPPQQHVQPADGAEGGPDALSLAQRRWLQEEAAARHAHIQGTAYAQLARATEAETAAEEAARAAKAAERAARLAAAADADGVDAEPLIALGKKVTRRFWRRRTASAARPASASGGGGPEPPVPALRHRKSADAPLRPILATLATNVTPDGGARGRERERGYVPYPGTPDAAGSEEGGTAPDTDESQNDTKHDAHEALDGGPPVPAAVPAHEEDEDHLTASREWAAALDADIPADIGQTQTIVEGRAVKAPASDDGHEHDDGAAAP